eukprot:2861495-Amphidinium_carterae.1
MYPCSWAVPHKLPCATRTDRCHLIPRMFKTFFSETCLPHRLFKTEANGMANVRSGKNDKLCSGESHAARITELNEYC